MATISINLDDQASAGLQNLNGELTKVSESTGELTGESAALTEEQQRQITLIQKSTMDWKTYSAAVVPAIAEVSSAGFRLAETLFQIAHASEATGLALVEHAGKALIDTASSAVQWTVATSGIVSVLHAWRGESAGAAEDANTLADRMKAMAVQTSISTIGFVTGMSPAIAAARAAMVGYEAILARTGMRIDEFGQKTSNLERLQNAMNDLTGDLSSNLAQGVREIPEYYGRLLGLDEAWQEIDKSVTQANDNYIENLKLLRQLTVQMGLVAESTEKFDNFVKRTSDDFARLRELTSKWGQSDDEDKKTRAAREYAEELGKIPKTLNYNLELERSVSDQSLQVVISRLDDEIRKREQAAGAAAAAGKFTVEQAKQHEIEMTALRDERRERERELDALLKSLPETRLRQEADLQKRNVENARAAYDARVKAAEEAAAKEKAIANELSRYQSQLIADARNEFIANIEARVKADADNQKSLISLSKAGDADKAAASKRIDTETRDQLHSLRLRQIKAETDDAIAAADTEEKRLRAFHDGERRRMQEESNFQRQEFQQQSADRREKVAEEVRAEQEKQAKLKALREQALEKAGIKGEDLLKRADPRDVLKNLQEQARLKAQQNTAEYSGWLMREGQFDSTGEARRKYDRLQRQAQQEAMLQARKDFFGGKTDPQQLAQAQAQVAGQQLQALNGAGKISDSTLQATTELLQATAKTVATQDAQQRQIDQLARDAAALNAQAGAVQQRKRAQVGSQ